MMYKHFLLKTAAVTLLLLNGALTSAQVTIGANKEPQSFSVLELISGDTRGLRLPQIADDEQRDEIFTNAQGFKENAAALGLSIFNMCSRCVETWNGTGWISVCAPTSAPDCVMIDGICWATKNVGEFGKFVCNETDLGKFYQWNRPTSWAATGDVTGWDSSFPPGTAWETQNDPCPNGWRVPTRVELESLKNNLNTFTTRNGVSGVLFGTAPNQIFLPAPMGFRTNNNSVPLNVGLFGFYWSSTESDGDSNSHNAYSMLLDFYDIKYEVENGSLYVGIGVSYRSNGMLVRCVKD